MSQTLKNTFGCNPFKLKPARISTSLAELNARMENTPKKHHVPKPVIKKVEITEEKTWNESDIWVSEDKHRHFPTPQKPSAQNEYFTITFEGEWPQFLTDGNVDQILQIEGLIDATVDELFSLAPDKMTYVRENTGAWYEHKRFHCWNPEKESGRRNIGAVFAGGRMHMLPCTILCKK